VHRDRGVRVRPTWLVNVSKHICPLLTSISAMIMPSFSLPSFRSSSYSKVTWPQHPAQLALPSRGSSGNPDTISLRTLIETRCPSVFTPFKPVWWLFKYVLAHSFYFCRWTSHLTQSSGHLQTIYASLAHFSRRDRVVYDRYATPMHCPG
jgi:hypothetical protein